MKLVPEETLAVREHAFDAARSRLSNSLDQTLLDDPVSGRCLKFYLLLTELPDLLGADGIPNEQMFWSRYYWHVRYATLSHAVSGPDPGLDQQSFQILEYPHPPCAPDWNDLESVHRAAERDAEHQLQVVLGEGGQHDTRCT